MPSDDIVRQSILLQAAHDFGFETEEAMLAAACRDSICPAICPRCGMTEELEPDGSCRCECGGRITSVLLLAGII